MHSRPVASSVQIPQGQDCAAGRDQVVDSQHVVRAVRRCQLLPNHWRASCASAKRPLRSKKQIIMESGLLQFATKASRRLAAMSLRPPTFVYAREDDAVLPQHAAVRMYA